MLDLLPPNRDPGQQVWIVSKELAQVNAQSLGAEQLLIQVDH